APTSAAVTVAGTEDTLKTFAASNFAFTDADSGSSISRILITIVESTGDLECNNKNGLSAGWEDCAANDYVAAGTDLRLTPASNSVADVTFSFKVYDGAAYSAAAYIFTTTHAAVNDAPTWTTSAVDVSGNEDTAITIGANVIADVDDSDMTMTVSSDNSGTFTLGAGIGDLTFSAGDGTDDTTMTFSGTVTEVNAALNSIAWTSASNDNTNSVLTLTANDGDDNSAANTVAITVNAVNDLPTTSTPSTQSGTEDTAFTGYATSDFPFTDADGDSLTSITITVVESSGNLEKSTDGSSYSAVSANDVILAANIQHLRLTPAADSTASVTFTYTVQDASGGTDSAVMTTSFAA
ncbi:MAG: hypothetical protein GY826_01830, partial [Fuerstiella sp.]|nr:hypothetical protein [Fuerstiella sp.]